jgi:hypothetical protein
MMLKGNATGQHQCRLDVFFALAQGYFTATRWVIFSSIRRFLRRASSLSAASSG